MSASSTVPATATELGPMINAGHREFVLGWIEKGIKEGATLVLDGLGAKAPEGYEKGFHLGPTIFDGVTEEMEIGREEVFGPVLCIKRVENYDEGFAIMNASRFANGSVIFTESKNGTSTWFTGKAVPAKISTWDGTMTR